MSPVKPVPESLMVQVFEAASHSGSTLLTAGTV